MVWGAAFLCHKLPWLGSCLCLPLAACAFLLAKGNPRKEKLLRAAAIAWLYYTVLSLYLTLFGLASFSAPYRLAVWLLLGLMVTLLWTPLELGRAWLKISSPILRPKLSLMSALGLVVILKSLFGLLADTQEIRKAISRRAPRQNWFRKITLFGQTAARVSGARSDELTRALMTRRLR
jgi:hypothetical protein